MRTRRYKLTLTTVGPVHIGSGGVYGAKDYFRLDGRTVGVLDAVRFSYGLNDQEREEYCRFLELDSQKGLADFLEGSPGLMSRARKCVLYQTEMTLAKSRRGTYQYFDVMQCIKDAECRPFVPGSSVKGMLRTALLAHLIRKNPAAYAAVYESSIQDDQDRRNPRAGRGMEQKAFWVERPGVDDVVNDIMRYVSVSDSAPLATSDLVFVKKYDKFSKGDYATHKRKPDGGKIFRESEYLEGNALNIYRECIKPGVSVEVTLDVDPRVDAYLDGLVLDREGLSTVLEESFELYDRCFQSHFDLDSGVGAGGSDSPASDGRCRHVSESGLRCRNAAINGTGYCRMHQSDLESSSKALTCYVGGGVGFNSKTVMTALLEQEPDGARALEISRMLYAQFPTRLDRTIHADLEAEVRDAGFEPLPMRAIRFGDRLKKGKDDHRHWKDAELGVSPHTAKLGIIGGKKYPMGRCSITIGERA